MSALPLYFSRLLALPSRPQAIAMTTSPLSLVCEVGLLKDRVQLTTWFVRYAGPVFPALTVARSDADFRGFRSS